MKGYKFKELCGKLFMKRLGQYFIYMPIAITEMLYYVLMFKQSIKIDNLSDDSDHITMHKMELFIYGFSRIFYDASWRALELSYYPLLQLSEV